LVKPKETYSNWLSNPNKIGADDTKILRELIDTYPFCSTSRILHLKGLQNTNNIHYNQILKKTAAYSSDRKRLFYFLTEEKVKEVQPKSNKKEVHKGLSSEKTQIKKKLKIGQPLEFDKEETHSFNEWLKLSQAKPIQRNKESENKLHKKVNLIEDFIANRDRKPKKEFYSAYDKAKESVEFHFNIVTETLAKVYLEQEHYEKAKAAYHQLCLKYPQKSSLFVSQIELIDQLITKNK
tara:strand:+ start:1139 stop:1849 length:711 start_codon:yes stop_codon:yes gene_type:complete